MVGLCVSRGFSCGNNKHGPDSGFVEHRGGYFIKFEQFSSPKGGDLTEKKKAKKFNCCTQLPPQNQMTGKNHQLVFVEVPV